MQEHMRLMTSNLTKDEYQELFLSDFSVIELGWEVLINTQMKVKVNLTSI